MPTFTLNGQPLPYADFATGEGEDAIWHPAANLLLWSDADLAALGVVRIPDPAPPPAPPPRAELPKDVVTQRLIDIGKASAVMSALRADDGQYALWFAPSWPNVYKDDARVIGLLQAAGLTADEIATVLA